MCIRDRQYFTEFDYKGTHEVIRKSVDELEAAWDAEQPLLREKCRSLLADAPELAEELLSSYTEAQAQKAWDWAWKMVEQLGEDRIMKNSSTPVSYTHLDVYKRQPIMWWALLCMDG